MCLSACATVTVQPASMTTSLVAEDSVLMAKAKTFTKVSETEGWVSKSSPMDFLQSRIFGTGNDDDKRQDYAERLAKDFPATQDFSRELTADIQKARAELESLNAEATAYIDGGQDITRADVVAFEDALVAAKKSCQSFENASIKLGDRNEALGNAAVNLLIGYEDEITLSRQLIERMTLSWQGGDQPTS